MATSHLRGHPIEYDFTTHMWIYSNDKSPADDSRPCIKCGGIPTPEGYDACTGYIAKAKSVCCGHGAERPILVFQ